MDSGDFLDELLVMHLHRFLANWTDDRVVWAGLTLWTFYVGGWCCQVVWCSPSISPRRLQRWGLWRRRQRWDLLSAGRRPRWQPLAQRCGRPLKRCRAKKRGAHMHIGSLDHLLFQWSWQRCARTPDVMITDGFPEFRGDFFFQSGEYDGILQVIVDADAPWQNGKYEKHGGCQSRIFWQRALRLKSLSRPTIWRISWQRSCRWRIGEGIRANVPHEFFTWRCGRPRGVPRAEQRWRRSGLIGEGILATHED